MSEAGRKLAAIMFSDIVGFTSLSQGNEALAIELLQQHRNIIRPFFPRHNGKEIKTMGDAFLVEFASALEAVRCAFDIQQSLHELNSNRPAGTRILLRIGIHLGDVIHSEDDVYGDAVNVASRIEPLAVPGGVCISEHVYDLVRNKFEFPMASLGKQELKNVRLPIEVYKMILPWERQERGEPDADQRRIAVMPFVNMSPDPDDEYFADGMTEEMISTISKIPGLSVISRTSVMKFKGSNKTSTEIAKELGIGRLLEGSVRKAGTHLRIAAQLIDAQTDEHLWSDSYDREFEDVFGIQGDISQRVAEALKVRLLADEKKRLQGAPTANMEAYTLFLKGRNYVNERTQQAFYKAIGYFEEAIKRDPSYSSAYAGLSDCYHLLENWGFLRPQVAWERAMEYAMKAVKMDDTLAEAHTSMAISLAYANLDWKGSEREYRRALELNPSYATARHWYAMHLLAPQRRWDEAIREVGEAAKLDPFSSIITTNAGKILFAAGRHAEGIRQFKLALEMNPEFAYAHASLGTALVSLSSIDEGTAEIEKALDLSPENIWTRVDLANAYTAAHRKIDVERILRELKEISNERYVPGTVIAGVYAILDEKDSAFEWLDRAFDDRTSTLPENLNEFMFDGLRTDPRFNNLLQRIGLA